MYIYIYIYINMDVLGQRVLVFWNISIKKGAFFELI